MLLSATYTGHILRFVIYRFITCSSRISCAKCLGVIHKVVVKYRLTKLERLLKAGVSANAGDGTKANNGAIHWAATFGGHESVKLLCGEFKLCMLFYSHSSPRHP